MVEITIMIEGGIVDANANAATVENTETLRQSFHRIFSELLNREVNIKVQPLAGYKNAARIFANSSENNVYLFVDLDDKKENKGKWFNKLATENPDKPVVISGNKKERVFFMIQEMEAWILKQPEAIGLWGEKNNYQSTGKIALHPKIAGKNIETIVKPSAVLAEIIRQYFTDTVKGKKIKYGKLKTAPSLLDCLDVEQLQNKDSEINRFYEILTAKNTKKK